MSKKQLSSVTQIVDEVGVISPFSFSAQVLKRDIKDNSRFSILCGHEDKKGIPRIWVSGSRYINTPGTVGWNHRALPVPSKPLQSQRGFCIQPLPRR